MRMWPIKRHHLSGFSRSSCLSRLCSRQAKIAPGNRLQICRTRQSIFALSFLLFASSLASVADETNTPPPALEPIVFGLEETNSNELLRAILELQRQVRSQEETMAENVREAREL